MGLSLSLRIEEHVSHYEDLSTRDVSSEWATVQRIDLEYALTHRVRNFITYIQGSEPGLHHPSQHGDDTGEIIFCNIQHGIHHLKDLPCFVFFEAIVPMLRYYERINRACDACEDKGADFIETHYRMVVEYH